MKHILKILVAILVFGCTKQIDFADDFHFKVAGINNQLIFINSLRDIELKISNINAQVKPNFSVAFQKIEGDLELSQNNKNYIERQYYTYQSATLTIKPKSVGAIKFKILVKDNNSLIEKEDIFQIYCTDSDFEFNFDATTPNLNPTVTNPINIAINLEKIGLSEDNFTLKYTNTKQGTLTINGNTLAQNVETPILAGTTNAVFTTNVQGLHELVFQVKNSRDMVKQVSLTINFTLDSFDISLYEPSISVKETLSKDFILQFTNAIAGSQYQILFSSEKASTIKQQTRIIEKDVFTAIEIPENGLVTFEYTAMQATNDLITIKVKDANQQEKMILLDVIIRAAPVIKSVATSQYFNSTTMIATVNLNVTNVQLSQGATISQYQYIIDNTSFGTSFYSTNPVKVEQTVTAPSNHIHWSKNYMVRVKDSDGAWSQYYNGKIQ